MRIIDNLLDKLKCSVGACDWEYISDYYDGDSGYSFGKHYKWVAHDGRVWIH